MNFFICWPQSMAMCLRLSKHRQILQVIDIAAWLEGHATPEDQVHVVMDLGDGR